MPESTQALATDPRFAELKEHLTLASELEHELLCAYLFTAYSLKQDVSEGITQDQVKLLSGWRGAVVGVAVQEMLHLALASNMLRSIGGEPHFQRQNFPLSAEDMRSWGYKGAQLGLWKFDICTLQRFVWFESYEENEAFPACAGKVTHWPLAKVAVKRRLSLQAFGLSSLVELYQEIAKGFVDLSNTYGAELFAVPASRQITDDAVTGLFNYPMAITPSAAESASTGNAISCVPPLQAVTDLSSALIAINTIISQGEGDSDAWQAFLDGLDLQNPVTYPTIQSPSHEQIFQSTLDALQASLKACTTFEPARDVLENPLPHVLTNTFTRGASELFDTVYGLMLSLLEAGFTQPGPRYRHPGVRYQVTSLTQGALRLMVYVMSPLGNALTQLSAVEGAPGKTAGPSFVYEPNPDVSFPALEQRLRAAAQTARALGAQAPPQEVWLTPSYLEIPPPGHSAPRDTVANLLSHLVADNIEFLADRLKSVGTYILPELHVCMGLNACKGQDVLASDAQAGSGTCATADPHICSGQNLCKHQGGCGFTPNPSGQPDLQDHPGQNDCRGQGACGSPILPSLQNTYGKNTDPALGRDGCEDVFARGKGYVWRYARMLFEERMRKRRQPYGPSRGPAGVGGNDFPGWSPPVGSAPQDGQTRVTEE